MYQNSRLQSKLPLYGPLDITDINRFLEESKTAFFERFNVTFHSDITMSDYDLIVTLGRGAFGTVKLVKDKSSDTYYAAKIQAKRRVVQNNCVKRVFIEKRVLQSIDFPFCVRLEHYTHDSDYIYFLMPFVMGGELYTLLKKFGHFKESMARFYAAQVVLALEFLQYIHFVYRDLKPENILIDHTGFLKITDFGLAKEVDNRTFTICGTPSYMAPEVVEGNGYARSADWWSLGVLIFEMVAGRTPFTAKNSVKLFTKIMYAPIPLYDHFSSSLITLLRALLNKDVTNRLGNLQNGAEDVKKHSWFVKINWLQLLNRNVVPPFIPACSGPGDASNFPYATISKIKQQSIARTTGGMKESKAGSIRSKIVGSKPNKKSD